VKNAGIALVLLLCLAFGPSCGKNEPKSTEDAGSVRETAVTFTTEDHRTLHGRVFGAGRVGVTLAHMFPADATSWYPAAKRIAEAGYMALAFDFRGFGESGGNKEVINAPKDIEAAAAFLEKRGAKDIVFVGASMGGTASIIAAATQKPLAVVAISAPLRFMGLDAPFSATSVQRPVLLLASRDDDAAFQAAEDFESALPNPDTKIYDGDSHGTNLLHARPEAVDEIIAFLKRYAPLSRAVPTTKS
jgi:pimeloyl-ACP methyl ester carboxylesterase